jgi:general secretion pathway protein A
MYYSFFGLTKNPFGMAPDSDFLFLTPKHREAVAGLAHAITGRRGFLVLSGEAGTGKTTVLTWMSTRLSKWKVATSAMLNPMLTPNEFLEAVMLGFGIKDIPDSRPCRFSSLAFFLYSVAEEGGTCVLIVDEAHKLSPELLEEIRLLGNFERKGEKLLQVLLIGQSELDDLLNRPDLRQLKQRICVRLTIDPLTRAELKQYIQFRWHKAGGGESPFSPDTIDRMFHWSGGIPRLANSLADNALMLAFAENKKALEPDDIDSAAKDLQLSPPDGTAPAAPPLNPAQPVLPPEPSGEPVAIPPFIKLATLERYETPAKPVPFFARWVGKLGLA